MGIAIDRVFSKSIGVVASEPVSALRAVVAYDDDHLVEIGAHLDAAGKTAVR